MQITLKKPAVVITDSRHIPEAIKRWVFLRDEGKCTRCGTKRNSALDYDHQPAWNLLNPKRHDPDKIFLLCREECHREKSKLDTSQAARAKRLNKAHTEGKKPSRNPIQSAGFPKGPKRKIQSPGFPKRKKTPCKKM